MHRKAPDSYHLSRRPANNRKAGRVLARRSQHVIEKPQNGSGYGEGYPIPVRESVVMPPTPE
ncbi:hypothetical protein ACNKHL_23170 [Shigella flexneri]